MGLIAPHGGVLIDRVRRGAAAAEMRERAPSRKQVRLCDRAVADLEMLAFGALSPLCGFMSERDYQGTVSEMRLANGLVWTLPVTLPVAADLAATIRPDEEVTLVGPQGRPLALMVVTDRFRYDKEREARLCYGTTESAHPGVRRLQAQGEVCLGGEIWLFERPDPRFPAYHLDPADVRRIIAERGWQSVVGFQTRNPVHRAHEYIQKCALEICDGLLLHPLVGETKDDDLPADVRMNAYETILERYYPKERTLLAVFPAAMRYAGPREAVWHAICRQNYGCSHFVVGRDHAGVGNYYGTYDAQRIFDQFRPDELAIRPLCFEHTFFCRACGNMASAKTCPHDAEDRLTLSGTKVREMLAQGVVPPPEFTRPEVAQVLIEGVRGR